MRELPGRRIAHVFGDIVGPQERPTPNLGAKSKANPKSRKIHPFGNTSGITNTGHQLKLKGPGFLERVNHPQTTSKPPCAKGSWHVSRLTSPVLPFHRKAKIALVMRVWTQPGMGITVAKYQRPDAPIVSMIVDLPLRESVRDFQRLSLFSSLETQLVQ